MTSIPVEHQPTRAEADPPPLRSGCPGCGGAWREPAADSPDPVGAAAVCERCGLERADAEHIVAWMATEAYAEALAAARSGRYAEARGRLAPALAVAPGEPDGPLQQLDALCATALGEAKAGADAEALVLARADYQAAREIAGRGDLAAALLLARRAVETAPQLVDAQKLVLLCLAGVGRAEEAERQRAELLQVVPGETDLIRWRFAADDSGAEPDETIGHATAGEAQAEPAAEEGARPALRRSRRVRYQQRLQWGVAASAGLSAVAAVCAATAMVRVEQHARVSTPPNPVAAGAPKQTGAAPEKPARPVLLRGTMPAENPSVHKYSGLAADLSAEARARRGAADFQQARAWFNRAVRAQRSGAWSDCDRLAAAAYALGADSYLGDEALLLRAQAAERLYGDTVAAGRYAEIAEREPRSTYADWALARAVHLAERAGATADAVRYARLLALRRRGAAEQRNASQGGNVRRNLR